MSKLRTTRPVKNRGRKQHNGDFADVKISDPAVRPEKISVQAIRRAVRAAHAKRLVSA